MKLTTVVNVRATDAWTVYGGRGKNPRTNRIEAAGWENPFSVKEYGRAGCMRRFFAHVRQRRDLVERAIKELPGEVLGCWCKPGQCHCDVWAGLANGRTLDEIEKDWAWIYVFQRDLFT